MCYMSNFVTAMGSGVGENKSKEFLCGYCNTRHGRIIDTARVKREVLLNTNISDGCTVVIRLAQPYLFHRLNNQIFIWPLTAGINNDERSIR